MTQSDPAVASPQAGRSSDNAALFRNAAPALVLAAMVSSSLHELAHAIAGLVQGLRPTVLPFAVSYVNDGTPAQQTVTAAAGPLFSLVLGLAVLGTAPLVNRVAGGFFRLFWLWLGHVAAMNFAGYLFIAPFSTAGDTGRAFDLLGVPTPVVIVGSLLGAAGQFALAWSFARRLKAFASDVDAERAVAWRAWIVGTVAVIVLTLIQVLLAPVEVAAAVLVLTYGVAIAIFAPMQFMFRKRVHAAYEHLAPTTLSRAGWAVTLLVAVGLLVVAALGGVVLAV